MASAFEFLTCQTLSTILVSDISKKKKKKKSLNMSTSQLLRHFFIFLGLEVLIIIPHFFYNTWVGESNL